MGNHVVSGWDTYEQHLWALRDLGVDYIEYQASLRTLYLGRTEENELRKSGCGPARLRKAVFSHPVTKRTIFIEEYAAYSYCDRVDGTHKVVIDTVRYREGERPDLDLWKQFHSPEEQEEAA